MRFEISFHDEVSGESVEDVAQWLLQYLDECVRYEDVSTFEIIKLSEED